MRNYKKEYANYHAKPAQKKRRASRNAARNTLAKGSMNLNGKDVAPRNGNPKDNKKKNLAESLNDGIQILFSYSPVLQKPIFHFSISCFSNPRAFK